LDVVDIFSYFRGPFFLHTASGPHFLVDVISVDLFSVVLFSEYVLYCDITVHHSPMMHV